MSSPPSSDAPPDAALGAPLSLSSLSLSDDASGSAGNPTLTSAEAQANAEDLAEKDEVGGWGGREEETHRLGGASEALGTGSAGGLRCGREAGVQGVPRCERAALLCAVL